MPKIGNDPLLPPVAHSGIVAHNLEALARQLSLNGLEEI